MFTMEKFKYDYDKIKFISLTLSLVHWFMFIVVKEFCTVFFACFSKQFCIHTIIYEHNRFYFLSISNYPDRSGVNHCLLMQTQRVSQAYRNIYKKFSINQIAQFWPTLNPFIIFFVIFVSIIIMFLVSIGQMTLAGLHRRR